MTAIYNGSFKIFFPIYMRVDERLSQFDKCASARPIEYFIKNDAYSMSVIQKTTTEASDTQSSGRNSKYTSISFLAITKTHQK